MPKVHILIEDVAGGPRIVEHEDNLGLPPESYMRKLMEEGVYDGGKVWSPNRVISLVYVRDE